jgi:ribonuclease D
VADAARQARKQKEAAAKPGQVITNDTLEPAQPTAPVPTTEAQAGTKAAPTTEAGSTEAQAAEGTAAAGESKPAATTEAKTEQSAKKEEEAKKALEALKQQIREMKSEVDLEQRALSLANEAYYSKPDFSKDVDGKAKLDEMASALGIKKEELEQLLAKLPAGETADEPKPAEAPPQP